MVLEGDFLAAGDGDIGVFEDHGPFLRVIDAFAGIGGVVLIPGARGSLREIDDGVFRDGERPVRAIGTGDDDGCEGRPAQKAGGEDEEACRELHERFKGARVKKMRPS